ncbi:sigma-70 family RNA polymerase sigma factor [Flavobacteriaceae bacterium]|nr:sigma-70 family RNA polymerase sigma factor [Flavobacteriaceae bacterium]
MIPTKKSKQNTASLQREVSQRLCHLQRSIKNASKFSTWLFSFTYNHCVNYYHRNKIKKYERNASNIEQMCDEVIAQASEDDLLQLLKLEKLNEAMELIPNEDKQILMLKYQDFKSIKDLMELHNAGESAIKMRLKRAKEKLLGVYNVVYCQALL